MTSAASSLEPEWRTIHGNRIVAFPKPDELWRSLAAYASGRVIPVRYVYDIHDGGRVELPVVVTTLGARSKLRVERGVDPALHVEGFVLSHRENPENTVVLFRSELRLSATDSGAACWALDISTPRHQWDDEYDTSDIEFRAQFATRRRR